MQRNQWSFSYKASELISAVEELLKVSRARLEAHGEASNVQEDPKVAAARKAAEAAGLVVHDAEPRTRSAQRDSRRVSDAELRRLERDVESHERILRTLQREDPHRMMKLHFDDLEFFGL